MRSVGLWVVLAFIAASLLTPSLPAQERWVYQYNMEPHGLDDEARSIVIGPDGSVYAAGGSIGDGLDWDFTIVGLTPSGGERWIYHYGSPGDGEDSLTSIVMGTDGNLYAGGYSLGFQFTVVSLDTSGMERWIRTYGSGCATSIVAGTDGNLYAAGALQGPLYHEFAVIGLDTSGMQRWPYQYSGGGRAMSIEMGSDGNLYAAGFAKVSGEPYVSFTVISLTLSGDERWVCQFGGDGEGSSIVMGADGNLYACGYSCGIGATSDFTVLSLTASGDSLWVYQYDGPANGWLDRAFSIAEGPDSNLYVAGMSEEETTGVDFTVVRLTPSGDERWVYQYTGNAPCDDVARSVAVGADGNVYAAGVCGGDSIPETRSHFTVISLSPSAEERWVYKYEYAGIVPAFEDGAHSIVVGADANLYAAGKTEREMTSYDFTVISLSGDVSIEERPEAGNKKQACPERSRGEQRMELQASPIPAVTGLKIHYWLQEAEEVRLSMYDVSGSLVRDLVNAEEQAGSRVATWDCRDSEGERVPSGTYFARLETSNSHASRRVVVFR